MIHLDELLARMPQQMRDDTSAVALVTALMGPFQELEDAAIAVLTQRTLDVAVGAQLDVIGALVGRRRGGLADEIYRRYIRAQILANRSRGIREDLIAVALTTLYGLGAQVVISSAATCEVLVSIPNIAVDDESATALLEFERLAVAAGIRVVVETLVADPDDTFTLDGPAGLGFVTVPTIDLADFGLPSGFDTVIGIRPEWLTESAESVTFSGSPLSLQITFGVESFDDTPPAIVFEAEAGTAIEDFENTIASSQYLFIVSASTVTGLNFTAGDVIPATDFTPGSAGGVLARAQE